jgi:hypothetical protein
MRSPSCSRAKAARSLGYTLIEVMMGVALSAIGITGITMMQTASVRSNYDAYESTVATNFARTWLERVKRDALLWTTAGDPPIGLMFAGRPNAGTNNYFVPGTGWVAPRPLPRVGSDQESAGANYHGIEVGSLADPLSVAPARITNADTHYCVHLRFATVQANAVGAAVAMSVDARVYWMRKGSEKTTQYTGMKNAIDNGCESAPAVYNDAQMLAASRCLLDGANNYCLRVHYLRTIVRMAAP